jgi:hypothetical protein
MVNIHVPSVRENPFCELAVYVPYEIRYAAWCDEHARWSRDTV